MEWSFCVLRRIVSFTYITAGFLVLQHHLYLFIAGNRDFQLETKHTSIPACYGSTYHSFVNADCSSDSAVTYPYTLFVGAKPKTLNCSTYDNDYAQDYVDGSTLQRDCCKVINLTNDCTDGYNDHNITLFKKQCIAKNKCVKWPVVWKPTHNMSCSNPSEYNEYSNFAYLEYYCIKSEILIDYFFFRSTLSCCNL